MLLPSPIKYSKSFRNKKLTRHAKRILNSILFKMKVAKVISRAEFERERALKFSWEEVDDFVYNSNNTPTFYP